VSLRELEIQGEYRSDSDNLLHDFYIPCLEKSITYSRAVGFFSSSSLTAAARGLTALINAGGTMQLVASPYLSKEDAEAIARGLKNRDEVITHALLQELEQEFDQVVQNRLECLAWLLQRGVLDIKLAIPKAIRRQGIYHEKLGIFRMRRKTRLPFQGRPMKVPVHCLMLFNVSGFLHGYFDIFDCAVQCFSGTVNFIVRCKFSDADSECAFNHVFGQIHGLQDMGRSFNSR